MGCFWVDRSVGFGLFCDVDGFGFFVTLAPLLGGADLLGGF